MYDDPGFITLSGMAAIALFGTMAALFWAAVLDGRDERAAQLRTRRS